MSWTSVPALAVGSLLKGAWYALASTAFGELQTAMTTQQSNTTRTYYSGSKTGLSIASGTNAVIGTWSSSGGYLSSGSGLSVPTNGVYVIMVTWTANAGNFSARTFLEIDVASVIKCRQGVDAAASDTIFSLTCCLLLSAGDVITPQRYQNTGATMTSQDFAMTITRVSV